MPILSGKSPSQNVEHVQNENAKEESRGSSSYHQNRTYVLIFPPRKFSSDDKVEKVTGRVINNVTRSTEQKKDLGEATGSQKERGFPRKRGSLIQPYKTPREITNVDDYQGHIIVFMIGCNIIKKRLKLYHEKATETIGCV